MSILRALVFLGLLAVGAMFSIVAVALLLVAGLGLWAYVYWKTRHLRRAWREQMATAARTGWGQAPEAQGEVIEGEVVRRESGAPDAHQPTASDVLPR